jgi:hypothetical protein
VDRTCGLERLCGMLDRPQIIEVSPLIFEL